MTADRRFPLLSRMRPDLVPVREQPHTEPPPAPRARLTDGRPEWVRRMNAGTQIPLGVQGTSR